MSGRSLGPPQPPRPVNPFSSALLGVFLSCVMLQNLEEFLEQMEAQKGVTGYRKAHAELVQRSEQTAEVRTISSRG